MKALREKGTMSEAHYRVTIKPLNVKEPEKKPEIWHYEEIENEERKVE
jgi:hypothetical protein